MRPSLIIGASGQVGEQLIQALHSMGRDVLATHYQHPLENSSFLQIDSPSDVTSFVRKTNPKIIFLPAALTNVDYCEQNPSETYQTNVLGVKNVVDSANAIGARVVYFSTDYIFDGKNGPYSESDASNPINEYGRHKLMAEHYVGLFAHQALIIRTTVVYGWERQGKNFIVRLLNKLRDHQKVQVPADQIGSPTYAPNLAQTCLELVNMEANGVYHLAGPDLVSRYEFSRTAAQVFGLDPELIEPVSTAELNQAAKRPLQAGLDIRKAAQTIQTPLFGYREGLQKMFSLQLPARLTENSRP